MFQVQVYAGAKELGTRSLNSRTWEFYKEKEFAAWKLKQENKMHVGLLNSSLLSQSLSEFLWDSAPSAATYEFDWNFLLYYVIYPNLSKDLYCKVRGSVVTRRSYNLIVEDHGGRSNHGCWEIRESEMGGNGSFIMGASSVRCALLLWSLRSHAEAGFGLQPSPAQHPRVCKGFRSLCGYRGRTCNQHNTSLGILGLRFHAESCGLWCAVAGAQWQNCTTAILAGEKNHMCMQRFFLYLRPSASSTNSHHHHVFDSSAASDSSDFARLLLQLHSRIFTVMGLNFFFCVCVRQNSGLHVVGSGVQQHHMVGHRKHSHKCEEFPAQKRGSHRDPQMLLRP